MKIIVAVVVLDCAACTAPDIPIKKFDQQLTPDLFAVPDYPAGCPAVPNLPSPTLDHYSNPTTFELQAFRGLAPGASMVLARVGAAVTQPAQVEPSSGRFCIEVTLIPDSSNTVTFTPIDNNGCPGRDTMVTLSHHTIAQQDAGVTSVVNVARGAPITSQDPPDSSGTLQNLNDGDEKTEALFSFYDWYLTETCDKYTWIRIDLGKVYTVSKIRVVWSSSAGDQFGKCYTVLLNPEESAGDPDPSPGTSGWTIPDSGAVTSGDAKPQVLTINPQAARWAALLLYEDNEYGLEEDFKVAEFEVWGLDPNAVPPPPPDRCE